MTITEMTVKLIKKTKLNIAVFLSVYLFFVLFGAFFPEKIESNFYDILAYFILFCIAVVLFYPYIWDNLKSFFSKKIYLIFTIWLLSAVAEIIIGIVLNLFQISNSNVIALYQGMSTDPSWIYYIVVIVIGPFVEEMIYRFCIFTLFPRKRAVAFLLSVFLFSFVHIWDYVVIDGDLFQLLAMLPYIPVAIGLCIIYIKTENIWYPFAMHLFNNLVVYLIKSLV